MKLLLTTLAFSLLVSCGTLTAPKNDLDFPNLNKWEKADRIFLPRDTPTIR